MGECCSSNIPCGSGQGDCDGDTECAGDLICGKNNCGPEFLWSSADCCQGKLSEFLVIIHNLLFLYELLSIKLLYSYSIKHWRTV